MTIQSLYTSIFNKKINKRDFVSIIISTLVAILIISFALKALDFTVSENDLVRKYQLSKLENIDSQVENIIIGDSAAGNGVSAEHFTKLSKMKTKNYSLTGSYGILGSLGILKKALISNKNIKNVIIVYTLDIWHRPYPKEALVQLFPLGFTIDILGINDTLAYFINVKEIWWNFKHALKDTKREIDEDNDYTLQSAKKYSNGLLSFNPRFTLNSKNISDDKIQELKMLQDFCASHTLNCIFIHGPMHQKLIDNSNIFVEKLRKKIKVEFKEVKYYDDILSYPGHKIGDSLDHIDIKFKNESTADYFNLIKNDLIK